MRLISSSEIFNTLFGREVCSQFTKDNSRWNQPTVFLEEGEMLQVKTFTLRTFDPMTWKGWAVMAWQIRTLTARTLPADICGVQHDVCEGTRSRPLSTAAHDFLLTQPPSASQSLGDTFSSGKLKLKPQNKHCPLTWNKSKKKKHLDEGGYSFPWTFHVVSDL